MKNMRKILAAVLAVVMVLAMMPAAFAADTTYTLDMAVLGEIAQGSKAEHEELIADDYFTIICSAKLRTDAKEKSFDDGFTSTRRLNFGAKTEFKETGARNAVKFTTSGAAAIKIWWACGGDATADGYRNVALFDKDGTKLSQSELESVKDSTYISEFTVDAAGTYYLGNVINQNYFFKIEVTETAAAADPAADSTLTVADAIALGASKEHSTYTEGKYYVTGVITEVYNTQYGNMKIADEAGNILTVYGTYSADGAARYDKLETKPVAGDTVTVYGIIGQYSNTPQMKNGWITAHTAAAPEEPTVSGDPAADSTLSVAEAIALGASKEHNTYTEGKYYVTGVVTEVYNEQYGNMYITDADGNVLTVYGTYSADGTNRYDKMDSKPVAGCVVTVYGIIGQYKDAPQMKNGWIISFDPAADSTLSIAEAIALGASKEHNKYTSGKYYVTGVITEVYNTQYGNMYITDEAGNVLTVYGTYSADGADRYDKLAVQPVVGDTVTVYGIIGQYKDAPQMKNGWITGHVPAVKGTTYTVKAGDTLGKIALAHYGVQAKYMAIFEANRDILETPGMIYVGQVLTLPGENLLAPAETETLYTIQPGDTLGKIALAHYGSMAQYKAIFERNSTHLASPDLIYAGQVIVLPAK